METKPIAIVIDDNEDLNAIFSSALEHAGYTVHSVYNGSTIEQLLNDILPTIITLDLHMPGISGEKVLEYIRSQPRLDKVRVIVTTADPRAADAMRIQPELVLLKPISYSQLSQLASRFSPNRGVAHHIESSK